LRFTNGGGAPASRPPPLANRELYFIYSIGNNACANLGLYRTISTTALNKLAVETYWTQAGVNTAHADRDVQDLVYPRQGHREWYECWNNYQSKVLRYGSISARAQWIHYPVFISGLHDKYVWEDVANFDVDLRMMLERETSSSHNPAGPGTPVQFREDSPTVLARLVAFTREARLRPLDSGVTPTTKPSQRSHAPSTSRPDSGSARLMTIGNYCARFNVAEGCKRDKCRYPHVCSACGGAHAFAACVDQRWLAGNPAIAFLASRSMRQEGGQRLPAPTRSQSRRRRG
jgi:hypothetical protein